ncbi:MAG: radical SAM protein [Acidimicrobiales bacterium]
MSQSTGPSGPPPDALPVRRPALPRRLVRYAERAVDPGHRARGRVRRWGAPASRPGDDERDHGLQLRWSACYAPSASLYLDQHGAVRACCQNTGHLLGDLRHQSLREVWEGAPARELREALARDDLSKGCEFCAWQRTEVAPTSWFSGSFDHAPVGRRLHPRWPRQLELALSNTCNLRCTMCNGEWSSAIRAQREHLPPLPAVYGDAFFDELAEFLPHLEEVHLLGGEPFLGREPLRVLDQLCTLDRAPHVIITTNATRWDDRVRTIARRLRPAIVVSLDGADRETYEAIRVGAAFDEVLANLDAFRATVGPRHVSIAHCLMVGNWHRFPELLALAEGRGLDVVVNTVRFPADHSLHQLPADRLAEVVAELEQRGPAVEATLTGSRLRAWHDQVGALAARARSERWPEALGTPPAVADVPVALGRRGPAPRPT